MKEGSSSDVEIFHVIGSFGPLQKKICLLLMVFGLIGSWHNFSVTFQAPDVTYRCVPPWKENFNDTSGNRSSSGDRYGVTSDQCNVIMGNDNVSERLIPCERWKYDTSFYGETIVSQWDLVCDREWLISLAKSIYMVGFMASMIVFGQMSDCAGRYPTLLVCYAITVVFGLLAAFSQSYQMFIIMRFFLAFGRSGFSTTGYVLLMEIIGPEYRTLIGIVSQLGGVAGSVLLPVLAWYFRPWNWLQLAMTLPLVPLAWACWIFPESPRWLRARGETSRLKEVLVRISKCNGRYLDSNIAKLMMSIAGSGNNGGKKRETLTDLVRTPRMRRRFIYTAYLWSVTAFLYYSLAYNTNELSGDPYENFFLSFVVEIPSYAVGYYAIRTVGRRLSLIVAMSATAASYAVLVVIPTGDATRWVILVLAMIGRFFVSGIFALLYLYTTELFPTVVRNTAVGSCSTFARIGSISAPFVRELGRHSHRNVPNVLNSALAISGVALAVLLPETKDCRIPDTLEEGENFSSESSIVNYKGYKLLTDLLD